MAKKKEQTGLVPPEETNTNQNEPMFEVTQTVRAFGRDCIVTAINPNGTYFLTSEHGEEFFEIHEHQIKHK